MGIEPEKDISRIFDEGTAIDEAMNRAARQAVLRHKQLGLPLVGWRDGKVVLIPHDDPSLESGAEEPTA
jgi:hypothetical protein